MFDQQAPNLFTVSGSPNGALAGRAAGAVNAESPPDVAWDGSNLWVCTTTGSTSTAVWEQVTNTNRSEVVVAYGTVSSGTVTCNRSAGTVHQLTVGGPLTIALTGFVTGAASDMTLELTDGGSSTITWPSDINWIIPATGATTTSFSTYGVELQSGGVDFIVFWSPDGTTKFGKVIR